jgi:NAD(P)H-nitrite reductase large subunit
MKQKADAPRGAILQRDGETWAIVPRTPVGLVSPETLDAISRTVRRFNIPIVKITSGQRMALVGLKTEDVEPAWAELGMDVGPASELCVHYVQACPGTAVCKLGIQDSLGLGTELEKLFVGRGSPAKVKLGVSGCPMCCGESWVRDIGFIGKKDGWTMVVGGSAAGRPRIGEELASGLTAEQAVELTDRFMDYYVEHSGPRLRVSRFMAKQDIEQVKAALL